jgi:drug/metabolite transporter (DMT)-like permease
LAALLLFGVLVIRRVALPRGRALVGSVLFGLIGFALANGLAYFALLEVPASVGMVILALVPLLTLLLAVAHRLERLRLQGLAGSVLAVVGVGLLFWERLAGDGIPPLHLLAVLGAALAIAETNVVVKRFPRAHPVANNAVAMAVAATLLLVAMMLAGQSPALPREPATIGALAYLVVLGSAGLFMLFLYIIERWTASSTSYTLLLMPLPAAVGGALLLGEPITVGLLAGGALIVLGVYLGAFAPTLAVPWPGIRRPTVATATAATAHADDAELVNPGCP